MRGNSVAHEFRANGLVKKNQNESNFQCLEVVALAIGTRQTARRGSAPAFPARNRLDSRTRVRNPSITAGIAGCSTPRITKIISAASPGESTLDVTPTPCTPAIFINSFACAAFTVLARTISAAEIGYTSR